MLKPIDKDAAFAAIAEDVELPLVLLANPDPRVRLVQLEKIGAALLSTNLTFRDLAERVTAPRPAAVEPPVVAVPPMLVVPLQPESEIVIDPATVLSNDELQWLGDYRTGPAPHFGLYGCGPIPDEFESIPGEAVESAGDRLALWAMAKSGQPFWQDPATGRAYLPGVAVPGAGVVHNDGTLGPLPVEE